jgi:sec-independent protein translocase protein TatC
MEEKESWAEHLEELRRRIIGVLVVFCAASAAAFVFSDFIVTFLTNPVSFHGVKLYTFAPAEKFMAYLEISVWTGAVVSLPFLVAQTGLFIWPALRRGEKKYALAALTVVPALFISGAAAAYKFLAPVVMKFFLDFGGGDTIGQLWSLSGYLKILFGLMMAAGVLLETPLILLGAFALGLTTPRRVARLRPYVVLFIFFLAGVLTPPDVISQIALGVPLYLLFEAALFAGKFFAGRK